MNNQLYIILLDDSKQSESIKYKLLSDSLDFSCRAVTEATDEYIKETLGVDTDGLFVSRYTGPANEDAIKIFKQDSIPDIDLNNIKMPDFFNSSNLKPLMRLLEVMGNKVIDMKEFSYNPDQQQISLSGEEQEIKESTPPEIDDFIPETIDSAAEIDNLSAETNEPIVATSDPIPEVNEPIVEVKKVIKDPQNVVKTRKAPKKNNVLVKPSRLPRNEKNKDFGKWYQNALLKSEMLDYYDISGCYIFRPNAMAIWDFIKAELNQRIQQQEGVDNAYFPIFVSQKSLEAEEAHLDGFKAEVAWVTHRGDTELEEKIAIRPTSETIMYPAFAKWIRSHRDLPFKINQWSNVVRWEFKDPTPFIRTREFLWQEGHTVHETKQEANEFSLRMLDHYSEIYEQLLAIPVIKGKKSDSETFAGADTTYTCEIYNDANGKGIQGATSHDLGKNFAEIFDISYENKNKEIATPYQTCWGFTTRSIGAALMVHGDDKGIVLPPPVAKYQVVIVPVYKAGQPQDQIDQSMQELKNLLEKKEVRCHIDNREKYTAGWKYNDWEAKGIPLAVSIGPNDISNDQVTIAVRFSGEKVEVQNSKAPTYIKSKLKQIHKQMFTRAQKELKRRIKVVDKLSSFKTNIKNQNLVQTPF